MSIKLKEPKICPRCEKLCRWFTGKICQNCYRRYVWKQKLMVCRRCKRQMPHHAKGLCAGCYHYVYFLEKVKEWNYKKLYNIDIQTYKKATKSCIICGFDKVVDLHHLDETHENNSEQNLIGLCPNHHQMFHNLKYRQEIIEKLIERGIKIPIICEVKNVS